MKKLRYFIEALLVRSLLFCFRHLSPDTASSIGGFLGRCLGTIMAASRKARRNLTLSLPNKTEAEYDAIISGMWENLGRVFSEYPHLETISQTRVTIKGAENLGNLSENTEPAIFFSAHLANWEVSSPVVRTKGIDIDLIYRPPNNPWVDKVLQECRSMKGILQTYPKSRTGMRQVMEALKSGRRIGILIDQKYNQGVEVNFFGRPAMTSPAYIQLAQKFNCPLIPVRIQRTQGCHFVVEFLPPLDLKLDQTTLLTQSHLILESWIADQPSQWLWLHRRWKS
jgi:KDO2-lipid IV(A) lauroyltransferase